MSSFSGYVDVLSRPDLIQALQGLVRDGAMSVDEFAPESHQLPRVTIVDRRVFCNHASMDLARRPAMLKLFQLFCHSRDGRLTREDLLARIYGISEESHHSARYRHAMYQNAVKLISRARAEAQAVFGRAAGPDVEWLQFDPVERSWILMRRSAVACREGAVPGWLSEA